MGWLDPWWADTIDLIVTVATVLATVASAFAINYTRIQSVKARMLLVDERRRLHEIDTLEELLGTAASGDVGAGQRRLPTSATARTLSSATRALIPTTIGFFATDSSWRDATSAAHPVGVDGRPRTGMDFQFAHLDTVTDADGNERKRTVVMAMIDELVTAIETLVVQDPTAPSDLSSRTTEY